MAPLSPDAPIGIYVHIPFCAHICPYCDFTTYRGMEALIPRYVEALQRDLERQSAQVTNRTVQSIFIGGGTPSLLTTDQVGAILGAIHRHFAVAPDAEVTLEANPNSTDRSLFATYRDAGVNRLSIGVQTTNRRGLRVLGRQHEAVDARSAVEAAEAAGFERLSVDLIFGWPGQTMESWRQDLQVAASWPVDHLSLYSLIIEAGTPMADAVHRRVLSPLDDDAAAELYEWAIDWLPGRGFEHYEVANWARSVAARSVHNQVYWRNGDFLGIGSGAHGTMNGRRTIAHLLPKTYIEAIEAGGLPFSNSEEIDERTTRGETMMLGLRLLDEGVERAAFERRHGEPLDAVFGVTLQELASLGMLDIDDLRVRLTRRGLMVANDVCARFL